MTTEIPSPEVDCLKKYKVIYADPPWDIAQAGARGAVQHYDLMTLDRIKAMPVADFADDNATLLTKLCFCSIIRHRMTNLPMQRTSIRGLHFADKTTRANGVSPPQGASI